MKALTAVSLFSGCGGFDLGARRAGLRIIWANDIDPAAEAIYREVHPSVDFVGGDVRAVEEFPKADVLIGCYPCTGFSGAARRRWRTRRKRRNLKSNKDNYLYREFLRALRQVQPKYFFVENVRGMMAAEDGWFLQRQIAGFARHGYSVKAEMLDAQDYGVPQSRRRLFIVGVRREKGALEYAFPVPTHGPTVGAKRTTLRDAIHGMERWPEDEFLAYPFHGHYLTRQRKRIWDQPSFTIVACARHVPLHPMGQTMQFLRKDTWALRGVANRRLSWRECAVIQGLPPEPIKAARSVKGEQDGYQTLVVRYRAVGNAVPPRLGEALVSPIVEAERARGRSSKR